LVRVSLLILNLLFAASAFAVDHSVYTGGECLYCHKMAFPSHTPGQAQRQEQADPNAPPGGGLKPVPPDWPVGKNGKLICLTCHDCRSGSCILRQSSEEICKSCHDCTQGMACLIKVAHMGNQRDILVRLEDCMKCHNGTRTKKTTGPNSHPVDILYIPKNQKYKEITEREVVLVDGKITCLSCHDPYKSDKTRYSQENELKTCRMCHNY
jgi:predicted CXXCH cytochrome family protein